MLNLGTLFVPVVPIIVKTREHRAGLAPYTPSDHCSGDCCYRTLLNSLELHCLQSEPCKIAVCGGITCADWRQRSICAPAGPAVWGGKWEPPGSTRTTMSPRENWVDKSEYERALRTYPDYAYSIPVNPWGFPTIAPESDSKRKLNAVLRSAMDVVPASVRAPFGLRDWVSEVDINIRDGRVSKVLGIVLVEGRSRWLNHEWSLVSEMPYEPMQSRAYMTEPVNILMRTGRSRGLGNILLPQASEQETQAAHLWNTACLTSLRSCTDRCELSPAAFQYMANHPDVSRGIWEPTCDEP
jgi:hypothetical protein